MPERDWNDNQPIYRQLRDRVVAMILDGVLKEGDPIPSVRNVAAEYRVNPLTVLKAYQQQRLTDFLKPDRDPGGTTYNITQSKNAIGAGQLRGRGPNNATQTTLNFLPEHHTDFVFASLAEERGFVGEAFLLMLYLLVVWRGLRIVTIARDPFSAIVAGGLVIALLFQVFVNVGMTMGIAPITGIPLPFVSVGGSSMIANLIAIGLLLSIHVRARARR